MSETTPESPSPEFEPVTTVIDGVEYTSIVLPGFGIVATAPTDATGVDTPGKGKGKGKGKNKG